MRVCVVGAVFYLFVAVVTATAVKVEVEIGKTVDLRVQTVPHEIDGCYITTPQDEVIQFKPNDESDKNKYKLLNDNAFTTCQVEVKVTDKKDNGLWSIYFTQNETVVKTEEYDLTVKSSDAEEETVPNDTTWLTPIDYIVKKGMMVEISLSRKEDVLSCLLTTPSRTVIRENEEQEGINIFKTNSDLYTSCRVQIGPMNDEALLGDWTLCSERLIANETIQECQSAFISWSNGNMNSYWTNDLQSKFDHPVHFGGNFTLTVKHYGDIKSCHVITPSGNDLTVLEDSNFPYITRIAPFTQCNVAIGPVDEQSIGDWTLYGIFTSFSGVTVVTLPTSFSLYNEINPVEQAYNVTYPAPILKITNTANTIELEVTGSGKVDSCAIMPPGNADIENNILEIANKDSCKYLLGSITGNKLGDWLVTGKFSKNNIHSEIRQVFTIKQEDPYNPDVDDPNRVIRYLESKRFETNLGETHEVVIKGDGTFRIVESCHVKIPDGRQYTVMEGFNIKGVEVEKGTDCALKITVVSKDMTGEWALVARKSDLGLPVEERLNFTIYIEEQVEAVPSQVTVQESGTLFVRLRDRAENYGSCKLYSPEGEYMDFEMDPEFKYYCGFIVKKVEETMTGTWHIVYEDGIVYRASIDVNIVGKTIIEIPDQTWVIDDKIDVFVGPENISYCQVIDLRGASVFEGFGQCRIIVNRVLSGHEGYWFTIVVLPGKIQAESHIFHVKVQEPTEYRPIVFTQVFTDFTNPRSVSLFCSMETLYPSEHVCKFRNPHGDVLIANEGLAQLRYMAVGSGTVYTNGVYHHRCGLRITNADSVDNGIWSCAIATSNDTYYGFLTVSAGGNFVIPALQLLPNQDSVTAVVGDEVTMSCSIQTNLQYCFFRKDDGTVYNLVPGISSDVEYYGAGFDAGECGIKFKTRNVKDSGKWTCNVGIEKYAFSKMKTVIDMKVYDELTLKHYINGKAMVINATAMQHHDGAVPRVDHCRYVRSDGYSFTSEAIPFSYMSSQVYGSTCVLLIHQLTPADYYPWTVTMKMNGRIQELTGVSSLTITYYYYYWNSVALWLWLTVTILGFTLIVLGFSLGPKKNRDWTLTRARTIRNSIRSSIRSSLRYSTRKAPLPLPSIVDDKPPAYSAE